ncbi:MAG: hypothetical protein GQ531_07545 [Sulfurovum sp.]|nr:hypothetical protein [Sulfurovum sp.]
MVKYNVEDLSGNVAVELTRSVTIVRDLNINLLDWKANGDGNWVLQEDNRSVLQTLNANPTIFHNNVNSQSEVFELTGGITVKTTGDDDFIGFVLGYNDGDFVRDDVDYLLIDWKQGDQTDGKKGLAISRVTMPITPGAWAHKAAEGVTELQRGKTLGNIGWKDNTEYIFKIIYTESLVEVYINDVKELNITGTYPDGAYGFYNYSQGSVLYSALFAENTAAIHLVANAGIDNSVAFGSEVILDASGSTSTNQIISYRWLEDGTLLGSEEIVIVDSFSVGEHNITLSIEDSEGNTDIDQVNIVITNSL